MQERKINTRHMMSVVWCEASKASTTYGHVHTYILIIVFVLMYDKRSQMHIVKLHS